MNEAGLYCLIFGSKKKEALNFRNWVTSEVLPSIRKNGYYEMVKPHTYFKDELDKYKDKDCVYILNVQDDIFKYGQSHHLNNRLNQHKKNLDYINVVRVYEMESINDILNLENKIKELSKELKINCTHNSGIEYFKVQSQVKLNKVLEQIDSLALNIKTNNSLMIHQSKMDSIILVELEKTKQAELDYLKSTKMLELQNENLKLQIELLKIQNNLETKQKSKIQEILDTKLGNNSNNQTNSTQIINSNIIINEKKCEDCRCDIAIRSKRCGPCENRKRFKHSIETNKKRPTLIQLETDLKFMSYVQIGKKYGVSDNCIRKWIRKFKSYNKLVK
jgi:predicted GIY-YIG superfamily endonuclease